MQAQVIFLLRDASAPQSTPNAADFRERNRTYHATGKTTAGAGAASIDILGGNTDDITEAVVLGNIALTLGTTTLGEGFTSTAPWSRVWARLNSISGTGAKVSVTGAAQ